MLSTSWSHVLTHYHDFDVAPSRVILEELVRRDKFPEAQLNLLTLYDEHLPVLHPIDAIEFKTTFRAREEAWAQLEFLDMSFTSRMIAEEQGTDAAPGVLTQAVGEERRSGPYPRLSFNGPTA
jgi:hypothetical protein